MIDFVDRRILVATERHIVADGAVLDHALLELARLQELVLVGHTAELANVDHDQPGLVVSRELDLSPP